MAESVGKRRSARTRLPSLKAELNDSSRSKVTSTPLSSRAKRYQKEKSIMHFYNLREGRERKLFEFLFQVRMWKVTAMARRTG